MAIRTKAFPVIKCKTYRNNISLHYGVLRTNLRNADVVPTTLQLGESANHYEMARLFG